MDAFVIATLPLRRADSHTRIGFVLPRNTSKRCHNLHAALSTNVVCVAGWVAGWGSGLFKVHGIFFSEAFGASHMSEFGLRTRPMVNRYLARSLSHLSPQAKLGFVFSDQDFHRKR